MNIQNKIIKITENLKNSNINFKSNNNKINNIINNLNIRNTHVDEKDLFNPIGILDPEGLHNNPLTKMPYKDLKYHSLSAKWSHFPMYGKREESIKTIYNNQVILVISGTGSGKTVLTPKFALHTLNYQGRIAITNPKRAPTKENAVYSAMCLDVELGKHVGMKYRDSDPKAYSSESKLIYATDGWILQKLQKDQMLSDLDMVIIDEAHERGIQIDLLLLLLKDLLKKRPDFKLIIMSATINSKIFSDYFPTNQFKFAMIDAGEVPNYPIEEFFLDKPINKLDDNDNIINDSYLEVAVDKVIFILRTHEVGDILILFPGKGDTSEGCMLLHQKMSKLNAILDKKIYCNVLTSTTDKETQDLLTSSSKYKESGEYTRKVIFATEVAESSITFDGVDFVIDSGLVNNNIFYSDKNMVALQKQYISKASHKQRKGRTGRTAPGTCFCLFTKEEYSKKFKEYPTSPILTEDISIPLLYFLSNTNIVSHINFPISYHTKNNNKLELTEYLTQLIERPQIDNIKNTIDRFVALYIIHVENNVGRITDLGRAVAVFETIPEIGKMLIGGYNYHCRDDIVNLAALLDLIDYRMDSVFEKFKPSSKEPSIKKREKDIYDKNKKKWTNLLGDHYSLINIYNKFYSYKYDTIDKRTGAIISEKRGDSKKWCKEHFLHHRTLENVKDKARQIQKNFGKVLQIFREKHPTNKPSYLFLENPPKISDKKEENIMSALLEGFYLNLIKKTNNKYINCFPNIKTISSLSQESLFAKVKTPTKYAFYSQLKSIFGKTNYSVVSKISPKIIEEMMKSKEGEYVKFCWNYEDKEVKKDKKLSVKVKKSSGKVKKSFRRR